MEIQKTLNSQSNLEKEEWNWRNQPAWLQALQQSHSHLFTFGCPHSKVNKSVRLLHSSSRTSFLSQQLSLVCSFFPAPGKSISLHLPETPHQLVLPPQYTLSLWRFCFPSLSCNNYTLFHCSSSPRSAAISCTWCLHVSLMLFYSFIFPISNFIQFFKLKSLYSHFFCGFSDCLNWYKISRELIPGTTYMIFRQGHHGSPWDS